MVQEMTTENKVIQTLQLKVDGLWEQKQTLQTTNGVLILFLLMASLMVVLVILIYHYKRRVNKEQQQNVKMMKQQQLQLEQITAELEKVKTTQNRDEHFLEDFKREIELHIDDSEYAVNDICITLHVSRAQLFRKIKACTGATPVDIIRQVRLRKARQLLQNTDLAIQQICYSVGFNLPSYFSKCYKDYFGISPSEEHRTNVK